MPYKNLRNKRKGYIDNKKDISLFKKAFMQDGNSHLFGTYNNAPIGFSYDYNKMGTGSNAIFFGSSLAKDRHNYENYVIQNLMQNNCSNIVVTFNSLFRENLSRRCKNTTIDYVINLDTYNPLDYLYQLYKKENEGSYLLELDELFRYINDDAPPFSDDPFRPNINKALFCLSVCYVIENDDIKHKDFNSVINFLQQLEANEQSSSFKQLQAFYENNPKKPSKIFFNNLRSHFFDAKQFQASIAYLMIHLQIYTSSSESSIDYDKLIKEKKNILIELPLSHNRVGLYKIFFSQYLRHRFDYIERNTTSFDSIPHMQIYLADIDTWKTIQYLDTTLVCGWKVFVGISLYCDDIELMKKEYSSGILAEPIQTILGNCRVKIFPAKNANQNTISLLRKEAQKSRLEFKFFDEVIPDADIQKFAENNKQIVLFRELAPIICDYFI